MTARCPVVIDVRSEADWSAGHARCAHNIEIPMDDIFEFEVLVLAKGDRSQPVQVYCNAGRRAARAVKVLQERGWSNVTNAGGWKSGQAESIKKLCKNCGPGMLGIDSNALLKRLFGDINMTCC